MKFTEEDLKNVIIRNPFQTYYNNGEPKTIIGKYEAYYNQIVGYGETKEEAIKALENYYK